MSYGWSSWENIFTNYFLFPSSFSWSGIGVSRLRIRSIKERTPLTRGSESYCKNIVGAEIVKWETSYDYRTPHITYEWFARAYYSGEILFKTKIKDYIRLSTYNMMLRNINKIADLKRTTNDMLVFKRRSSVRECSGSFLSYLNNKYEMVEM